MPLVSLLMGCCCLMPTPPFIFSGHKRDTMPFTGFSTLHWISLFLCVTSHGCVGSWLCTAGSPIPATNWIKNYFRTQAWSLGISGNLFDSFEVFTASLHCSLRSSVCLLVSFFFILAPNFKSKHNTGCFPRKDYIAKSKTLSSFIILEKALP